MKIFLSCQQSPHRYPIPAYGQWRDYLVHGLQEAGHAVLENEKADWALGLTVLSRERRSMWKTEIWTQTLDTVRKLHAAEGIDLFLSYFYPSQVDSAAIREIRALGIPCVNFFCDNVREYARLPQQFAPFDLHWVPEIKAMPLYKKQGWSAVFAPMPCWVPPERRQPVQKETRAVSFIGGHDGLRAELLARVAHSDLPLQIRGPGWISAETAPGTDAIPPDTGTRISSWMDFLHRQGAVAVGRRLRDRFSPRKPDYDFSAVLHPKPPAGDYEAILAESAVSLGINRYPSFRYPASRPDTYSRLRDIEAPMLGACYLTEWAPELEHMYELETEIATYRDADELIAKARALLADTPRRKSMRAKAQRRALEKLTIGKSLEKITRSLGLQPSSSHAP